MKFSKYQCYAIGLAVGLAVGLMLAPDAKKVLVDNETKWCFYQETPNLQHFEATKRPQSSFIVSKGTKYHVFAPCDTFDWYAQAKRP